jgi:hypothetical protein
MCGIVEAAVLSLGYHRGFFRTLGASTERLRRPESEYSQSEQPQAVEPYC